jgi:hypothetical protein
MKRKLVRQDFIEEWVIIKITEIGMLKVDIIEEWFVVVVAFILLTFSVIFTMFIYCNFYFSCPFVGFILFLD